MELRQSILVLLLAIAAVSNASAADNSTYNKLQTARLSADEAEVWKVIEEWNAAFSDNDVERYFSFIDDDITVITPSNPYRVEGISDDREEFELGIRFGYSRVSLFQEISPMVRVFGDVAYVSYFNRGYYGPESGGKFSYLKETDVLRRVAGNWKIAHIHVSD